MTDPVVDTTTTTTSPGVNAFQSGNDFYILDRFDDELKKSIILPLTQKLEELKDRKSPTLTFYINSVGGSGVIVLHLVRLFEVAKKRGFTIRTVVPQIAYSAGSMLAIAGTPGERYIGDTGEHLIHYGYQGGSHVSTPLQVERTADHKLRWFATVLAHYKKYANVPRLGSALKDDDYFIGAADCIKFGLADKDMLDI